MMYVNEKKSKINKKKWIKFKWNRTQTKGIYRIWQCQYTFIIYLLFAEKKTYMQWNIRYMPYVWLKLCKK